MKTIVYYLMAASFILISCKSNTGVSDAFGKYSGREGVTSISVPGWLISIAARTGHMEQEQRDLLKNIDKVKILAIEDEKLNNQINLHSEFHSLINVNNDYEELLTLNEEGEQVTIFGKMDGDVIREMVVLVGGRDNALVYLKGHIEPEMIASIKPGKKNFFFQ